jgi:hypothetical protein
VSFVDVHPEDLIDREARGALSADERAHLDAHLARCAACRLERQVRADFAAELAPRLGAQGMHELVHGALLGARDAAAPLAVGRTRSRFRALALLVAVPALLVSGLAFAQTELAVRFVALARDTLGMAAPAPAEPAGGARAERRSRRPVSATARSRTADSAPLQASAPAPVSTAASGGALALAPEEAAAPALAPAPTSSPRHARAQRRRRARASAAPAVLPETEASAVAAQVVAATPQALFERANSARRAGRMLEASALYRELGTRFAASHEARVAVVLLARLQLDGGESEAALDGFEAYLASGHGALREQAMVGRAQALRRLGRAADERAAVGELLRAYPDAPYARLARERLGLSEP